jgi:alpha-tubulin suppressor-like RCC1 family protein
VVGLSGVTALAVGAGHGCAVLVDATVACWGQNDRGQLGAGDPSGPESCASGPCSPAPVPVLGLFDASDLAAGWAHTCALRLDGTVWCWGDNAYGQLGDGTTDPHALPVEVAGLPPIVALSLRSDTSCGLDLEGTAWCWGLPAATPQPWPFPGPYAALALGESVTCALDPAAALWCWGEGAAGLLGTGGTGDATAPARVD